MRGSDAQQQGMWSYLSPEKRVPRDHPLRPLRAMVDVALEELSPALGALYAKTGRASVAPEKLLRALLLQILFTIRSERQLMEQLDYNLLFRWFVGLGMDDPVWDVTVFTKNRDRLLAGDVAGAFFEQVLAQARQRRLLSAEHFTVDGTLIEAWASQKSFRPQGEKPRSDDDDDPGNCAAQRRQQFEPPKRYAARRHAATTGATPGRVSWMRLLGSADPALRLASSRTGT